MKTTNSHKQIPLRPFRRTPGELSKELPKFDDVKNNYPFVEAPKTDRVNDPQVSKATGKSTSPDVSLTK